MSRRNDREIPVRSRISLLHKQLETGMKMLNGLSQNMALENVE